MNIHKSAHVHDTRREQRKEGTTRSGVTAPTERHCADQARHTKWEQDKISTLRGSQNIPPDWESPEEMLETLRFPQQKTVCVQVLPTWNTMATVRGQGTEGKTKYAKTS